MKKLKMLRLTKECMQGIPNILEFPRDKFFTESYFVCLGELKQMPTHGIFVGASGNIYPGYHLENFEVIPEDYV